jgi:membrane-bound lytic murein transglycosylase B
MDMTAADRDKGKARDTQDDTGVLANLPRTRPQRSSPRRAAARQAAVEAAAAPVRPGASRKPAKAKGPPAKTPPATAAKTPPAKVTTGKRTTKRHRDSAAEQDAVPRQGFESDGEIASGPVQPPGGVELLASAAEIAGELAKAGLSTGERLLKDAISRLTRR